MTQESARRAEGMGGERRWSQSGRNLRFLNVERDALKLRLWLSSGSVRTFHLHSMNFSIKREYCLLEYKQSIAVGSVLPVEEWSL